MIDLTGVKHHPAIDEMVDVLCNKTQNTDRGFFQVEAAYFMAKMAASMRATIVTKDRGEIPVSLYALALAGSGYGKGYSVNIMEDQFLKPFKRRFMEETFHTITEQTLWNFAGERALRSGGDQQEELEKLEKEFRSAGAFPFTFDSGTPPAVKQLRHKLLLAGCGSINLQIDEIGSHLITNQEVLTLFLELFDQGLVKQKLVKNTNDNVRGEEVDGKTPTNMLLFGTPNKLFDGSQTEDQFYSFLETGYARRCLFGSGQQDRKAFHQQTPEEIYYAQIRPENSENVNRWAGKFYNLADPTMFGWKMIVEDDVAIELLKYKIICEQAAENMAEHEEIKKAEIAHRYFKALKLAGAYAFVDKATEVTIDNLMSAILLVEESGVAFQRILSREPAYAKLAKYIATCGNQVTHADLLEALPFYKSGTGARNEMMTLATAWGYKKHIVIKKTFIDGIEFFEGETLKETNLNDMIFSYSDHWAYHYGSHYGTDEPVGFFDLHMMTQQNDWHWSNHRFTNQHRSEENAVPGFNMIVIDVDEGINLHTCHEVMKDYKFMTYTTKRHSPEENRFRLILPINYIIELDSDDYKEFMNSVMMWLPFKTDESANQRSKKWMTHGGTEDNPGIYHYNSDGEILDALRFIPKTSKNEEYRNNIQKLESLDNLERWFAQRISMGNRNNNMIKYALALVDSGFALHEVTKMVQAFNKKLNNPLSESEIESTVLTTAAKRFERKTNV